MPKRQNLSLQSRARAQPGAQRGKQKPDDGPHGMEQLTDVRPIRSMLSNRMEFLIGTAIYPCVFSRFRPVGSVKDGIAEVVGCKALRNFREEVYAVDQWRHIGPMAMTCSPEEDPGPCNPEQDPGPCSPEQDPGPCNPEQDPGPCDPEKDPGPCDPESNPG